jgi:hypothetical protein
MSKVLFLTFGQTDGVLADKFAVPDRIGFADLYDLDRLRLEDYTAVLISMHVDQRFLAKHAERIDLYVRRGGTMVANGHMAYPFLRDVALFHPLHGYRLEDLTVRRQTAHSVWEGVAEAELTFRRGVAGFYGRGWHQPPAGATVIHVLGDRELPLDFTYRLGAGRVLFHGGNDLWQYANAADTTARIVPQLFTWIDSRD